MPYRRFPKTDRARVRSLKDALYKAIDVELCDMAFPRALLAEIRSFLPHYENDLAVYSQKLETQNNGASKYRLKEKYARMYISHFLQTVFMSEMRGEFKPEHKLLYGLDEDASRLPDLSSEDLLQNWGKKIIEGEKIRMQKGGSPIYSPSIAKVKVRVEIFSDAYEEQKLLRTHIKALNEKIQLHRAKADGIISELWNEVESYFSSVSCPSTRISKCKEYGVIYYYRKGELKIS